MPHFGEVPVRNSAATVAITPGASPYSYMAPSSGVVVVSGGTVSEIALNRGADVVTGLLVGAVPTRGGDVVKVTYAVAPTMTFFPG